MLRGRRKDVFFFGKAGCNGWQARIRRNVPCPRSRLRIKEVKKIAELTDGRRGKTYREETVMNPNLL